MFTEKEKFDSLTTEFDNGLYNNWIPTKMK